jgi:hypothetical protein
MTIPLALLTGIVMTVAAWGNLGPHAYGLVWFPAFLGLGLVLWSLLQWWERPQ